MKLCRTKKRPTVSLKTKLKEDNCFYKLYCGFMLNYLVFLLSYQDFVTILGVSSNIHFIVNTVILKSCFIYYWTTASKILYYLSGLNRRIPLALMFYFVLYHIVEEVESTFLCLQLLPFMVFKVPYAVNNNILRYVSLQKFAIKPDYFIYAHLRGHVRSICPFGILCTAYVTP